MNASYWWKAGVVLSVIWFIGFGSYMIQSILSERANNLQSLLSICKITLDLDNLNLQLKPPPVDERDKQTAANAAKYQKCQDDAHQKLDPVSWGKVLQVGGVFILMLDLVSLLVGWGIGWGTFLIIRRIGRGLRPA